MLSARHFITNLSSGAEQKAALRLFTNPEHAAEVTRGLTMEQNSNVSRAVKGLLQSVGNLQQTQQVAPDELRGLFP